MPSTSSQTSSICCTEGKLATPLVQSQTIGVNESGSSYAEEFERLVGDSPMVKCSFHGVPATCLLDSGAQCTMVSETFYSTHFGKTTLVDPPAWLDLTAANDLQVPYIGYFECDVTVNGETAVRRGVLVKKGAYEDRDGTLGTNVLKCLKSYAHLCPSEQKTKFAKLPDTSVFLPAESMRTIMVKGPTINDQNKSLMIEPLSQPLTGNVKLIATVVKSNDTGWYPVQFANQNCSAIILEPNTRVGLIEVVQTIENDVKFDYHAETNEIKVSLINSVASTPLFNIPPCASYDESDKDSAMKTHGETSVPDWIEELATNAEISEDDKVRLQNLLVKYAHIFGLSDEELGYCDLIEHKIRCTDNVPIRQHYRRIPPTELQEVKDHISQLLKKGVIQPSCSPYASPIVIVRKKSGKMRMCVDFRALNLKCIKDAYPLPRIEEGLDSLAGSSFFSSLDLQSAYNQINVAKEDREKTAFTTPFGLFEYIRMPFGLCSSPATFMRLMNLVFREELYNILLIYLDDILVFANSFDQHLERLEIVFQVLSKTGLKVEPNKCSFFSKRIQYLGHIVSPEGVGTDPDKVKVIEDWPKPVDAKEVRSFLGIASYYRRYIRDFTKRAAPLQKLITDDPNLGKKWKPGRKWKKKGTETFLWTDDCQSSFDNLKLALTTAPVLAFPDFTKPFKIEVDASHQGLGAVLSQKQDDDTDRVIAYASRGLRGAEKNMNGYSSMKLELLTLKWAITEKFKDYLHNVPFIVYTDNNPLSYFMSTAKLGATEQRWAAQLAQYDFKIKYRPGRENRNADSLSRRPQENEEMERDIVVSTLGMTPIPVDLQCNVLKAAIHINNSNQETLKCSAMPSWSHEQLVAAQKADKDISRLHYYWTKQRKPTIKERKLETPEVKLMLRQWDRIVEQDDLLYRNVKDSADGSIRKQLIVPRSLRDRVLEELHDNLGHQMTERTESLVRTRCYWPKMHDSIKKWIEKCQRCT